MRSLFRLFFFFLIGACLLASASNLRAEDKNDNLTLGQVQRSVKIGDDQPTVASALGNPNIVMQDSSGNEVWTYDKMATSVQSKESGHSFNFIIASFGGSHSSGSSSQRTLTVVIKFDAKKLVKSVDYHSSSF